MASKAKLRRKKKREKPKSKNVSRVQEVDNLRRGTNMLEVGG